MKIPFELQHPSGRTSTLYTYVPDDLADVWDDFNAEGGVINIAETLDGSAVVKLLYVTGAEEHVGVYAHRTDAILAGIQHALHTLHSETRRATQ